MENAPCLRRRWYKPRCCKSVLFEQTQRQSKLVVGAQIRMILITRTLKKLSHRFLDTHPGPSLGGTCRVKLSISIGAWERERERRWKTRPSVELETPAKVRKPTSLCADFHANCVDTFQTLWHLYFKGTTTNHICKYINKDEETRILILSPLVPSSPTEP